MPSRIQQGLLLTSTALLAVFAVWSDAAANSDMIADVLAKRGVKSIEIAASGSHAATAQQKPHAAKPETEELTPLPVDGDLREAEGQQIRALDPPSGITAPGNPAPAINDHMAALEPYQLIRSLQFVQDSVVKGDHSAMEMQRFLLGVIDDRLRKADQEVFDNPRNVDAALIYAMSGGNPATLDLLALQDRFGNFDNEITTVLRAYLEGRAARTSTSLEDILAIYRNSDISPYLSLVAANVKAGLNQDGALEMFDWARLGAPGTIIEEAALRRSLSIATKTGQLDRAINYATLYARRFINSPYAGQFADELVDLAVDNYQGIGDEKLISVLAFMDQPRQREVYLRIARKAAISGERELALLAADKAKSLSGANDLAPAALAGLYSGLANISSGEVMEIDQTLAGLENVALSPRDAALRKAARLIANEIVRQPDPNSLTQAFSPNMDRQTDSENLSSSAILSSKEPGTTPKFEKISATGGSEVAGGGDEPRMQDAAIGVDPEFRAYLEGQSKLIDEIDQLLASESGVGKQ